jgi:hypothetical protein
MGVCGGGNLLPTLCISFFCLPGSVISFISVDMHHQLFLLLLFLWSQSICFCFLLLFGLNVRSFNTICLVVVFFIFILLGIVAFLKSVVWFFSNLGKFSAFVALDTASEFFAIFNLLPDICMKKVEMIWGSG